MNKTTDKTACDRCSFEYVTSTMATVKKRLVCQSCAHTIKVFTETNTIECYDCEEPLKIQDVYGDLRYNPARCLNCYEENKYERTSL